MASQDISSFDTKTKEVVKYQFPVSKRIKRLDKQLARKPKKSRSKNRNELPKD
jgi:hypothetical protein